MHIWSIGKTSIASQTLTVANSEWKKLHVNWFENCNTQNSPVLCSVFFNVASCTIPYTKNENIKQSMTNVSIEPYTIARYNRGCFIE